MPPAIRILLVDGLPAQRRRLGELLSAAEGMEVVAQASTEAEALRLARELAPAAIVIGGTQKPTTLELVTSIMRTAAAPIVVVFSPADFAGESGRVLKAGAVAALQMPKSDGVARSKAESELSKTVRAMSQVKVVTRRPGRRRPEVPTSTEMSRAGSFDVIAIGASTGGPQAVSTILSGLPADLPVPVLIVQHMTVGFQGPLLEWLNLGGGPAVRVPVNGEPLAAGVAYLAPDEVHMGVQDQRIELTSSPPENGLRPAVSYLFKCVRQAYGSRAIGVLLTGMGRDGADELKLMRDVGGVTIAQDEKSCVVYGMPKEAVKIGGASYVLGIENVAPMLVTLTGARAVPGGGGK